jgi:hypothetical protein
MAPAITTLIFEVEVITAFKIHAVICRVMTLYITEHIGLEVRF